MNSLTIGQAAKRVGVSVDTIRFYEKRGLIEQPPKADRRVRRYEEGVVSRLAFIKDAQQLGFSLREIQELLNLHGDSATDCDQIRALALEKKQEVTEKIATLESMNAVLDRLISDCPRSGNLDRCSIIRALTSR